MQDIIVHRETDELIAEDGDFVVSNSDMQHKKHLLLWNKGAVKEHPTACVGAFGFLEAEDEGEFIKEVSRQYSGDGMNVQAISYKNGKLNIVADY